MSPGLARLGHLRDILVVIGLVLLAGCAGPTPVEPQADTAACPRLTGSYCAWGQLWEEGRTELEDAHLPHRLGLESADGRPPVDRVDLMGVADDRLAIVLRAGREEVARAELARADFLCGDDRLMLRVDAMMWSGGLYLGAYGASSGWRMFRRAPDGSLRIDENRRETGAVFFVIPLRWATDLHMRFPPAEGGCVAPER